MVMGVSVPFARISVVLDLMEGSQRINLTDLPGDDVEMASYSIDAANLASEVQESN